MILVLSLSLLLTSSDLSTAQWEEDLEALVSGLATQHCAWTETVDVPAFDAAAEALRDNLGTLDDREIITAFVELCALANDDSTLIPYSGQTFTFRVCSHELYWFHDGWFIVESPDKDLVGSEVLQIGAREIEDVFQQVSGTIAAENELAKRWRFPLFGLEESVLRCKGILPTDSPPTMRIRTPDGDERDIPMPFEGFEGFMKRFLEPGPNTDSPVVSNDREHWYYYESLDYADALYVQISKVRTQAGRPRFDAFARDVCGVLETTEPERLILDLRHGGGGSGENLAPLLDGLHRHFRDREAGSLFVLIGRRTAGTVLELASLLENVAPVVFVGEPTSDGPNSVGDTSSFSLPNSGLRVQYTTTFWKTSLEEDPRPVLSPHITVEMLHEDYAEGFDPTLDLVDAFEAEEPDASPASPAFLDLLEGRYVLADRYDVRFTREGDVVRMTIDDDDRYSFFRARTRLRPFRENEMATNITDVTLHHREGLWLSWRGIELALERR